MAKVCILILQFVLFLTLFLLFPESFDFLINFCCQKGFVGLVYIVFNYSQAYFAWLCFTFLYILDSLSSWVFAVDSFLKDWYYCHFIWICNGFQYPVLVPWHVNIPKHFCVKGNSTLLLLFIFLLYFLVACQVKKFNFFLWPAVCEFW